MRYVFNLLRWMVAPVDLPARTMPSRSRTLALAAILAVLVAGCASPSSEERPASAAVPPASAKATTPASPDAVQARFEGFAGGPGFELPKDLAGKPLVLNVWASWCTPCRKEMPAFQSVYEQARAKVGFLGVDYLDEAGAARRLAADTRVTYPLAADPKGTEVSRLGVTALPTTLFISADGVVRGRRFGELNGESLRAAIRTYLRLSLP